MLAYQNGRREQDLQRWWTISIPDGRLQDLGRVPLLPGETQAPSPFVWTAANGSTQQWVLFGRSMGDTYNLFRVGIARDGKVASDPEQLTFTTGTSRDPSVSGAGRMVFDNGTRNTNLWSIPIDTDHARLTGERRNLTQLEEVNIDSPSLSRDGKKVAFFSESSLVVKDIATGRETQLTQNVSVSPGTPPAISPDGSFVAYYLRNNAKTGFDLYRISTAGGGISRICEDCGQPGGFSSDGTRLLTQKGSAGAGFDKIALVEIPSGKVTDVLRDPQHGVYNPNYSWDDKWMGFVMETDADFAHFRLYITPVENFVPAGRDRWIQLTSGEYYDDKQQFSPDGNTIYFTSNRDGFTCLWALRLDTKTKRPLGAPFAIQHFHAGQRIYPGISQPNHMEVTVARDKIVTNLDEFRSDIWMMQLDPGK